MLYCGSVLGRVLLADVPRGEDSLLLFCLFFFFFSFLLVSLFTSLENKPTVSAVSKRFKLTLCSLSNSVHIRLNRGGGACPGWLCIFMQLRIT